MSSSGKAERSEALFVDFTPIITLTTNLIVSSTPPERAGAASALSETAGELGGALGIAVLGSLSAALYPSRMENAVTDNLPPELARAAKATLGGAVEGARVLSADTAETLLATARGPSISAFR